MNQDDTEEKETALDGVPCVPEGWSRHAAAIVFAAWCDVVYWVGPGSYAPPRCFWTMYEHNNSIGAIRNWLYDAHYFSPDDFHSLVNPSMPALHDVLDELVGLGVLECDDAHYRWAYGHPPRTAAEAAWEAIGVLTPR